MRASPAGVPRYSLWRGAGNAQTLHVNHALGVQMSGAHHHAVQPQACLAQECPDGCTQAGCKHPASSAMVHQFEALHPNLLKHQSYHCKCSSCKSFSEVTFAETRLSGATALLRGDAPDQGHRARQCLQPCTFPSCDTEGCIHEMPDAASAGNVLPLRHETQNLLQWPSFQACRLAGHNTAKNLKTGVAVPILAEEQ